MHEIYFVKLYFLCGKQGSIKGKGICLDHTPPQKGGNAEIYAKKCETEKADKKFLLSGFGRKPEVVDIYKIPEFFIKDEKGILTFQNLYIASSFGRNFGCDLILSATMFKHMDYSILNRKRNTSVLEIKYDRDLYYTQLILNQKNSEFTEKIFSFSSVESYESQTESGNIEIVRDF